MAKPLVCDRCGQDLPCEHTGHDGVFAESYDDVVQPIVRKESK